ncbi:MAG: HAMP domain-containing sensor histidine kinase [Chloroflexota bacterium]
MGSAAVPRTGLPLLLRRTWARASLLTRFTLIGVSLTGLIGLLLGWAVARELERSALWQEAESAADLVKLQLEGFLRADDFDGPPDPMRFAEIDRRVRENILHNHIVRIKIWGAAGLVVYATDAGAVGQQYNIEEGLDDALQGRLGTSISDLSKEENRDEQAGGQRLMEIYLPARVGGDRVVGAYELYHDLAVVEPRIAAMQRFLWVSLATALALLYLALFGVVRRASVRLRAQNEELGKIEARREIDRLQTEFVSVVSHELRTPLTALVGFSELLMTRDVPEAKRQEWTATLHSGTERLAKLVEDLLDVTRIEEGRLDLFLQPTSLQSAVEDALATFGACERSDRLVWRPGKWLPPVMADPDKLVQILTNLVSNAIKYSANRGEITVAAELVGSRVRLSVADHGLGLPAGELQRIFERFHRVRDQSRQDIQGTGLGLYITRHLVELQGGRIWAESRGLGRGSTFFVELPAASPVPVESGAVLV